MWIQNLQTMEYTCKILKGASCISKETTMYLYEKRNSRNLRALVARKIHKLHPGELVKVRIYREVLNSSPSELVNELLYSSTCIQIKKKHYELFQAVRFFTSSKPHGKWNACTHAKSLITHTQCIIHDEKTILLILTHTHTFRLIIGTFLCIYIYELGSLVGFFSQMTDWKIVKCNAEHARMNSWTIWALKKGSKKHNDKSYIIICLRFSQLYHLAAQNTSNIQRLHLFMRTWWRKVSHKACTLYNNDKGEWTKPYACNEMKNYS